METFRDIDVSDTGMTVLAESSYPEAAIDIVFVHGMFGHPRHTWAHKTALVPGASSSSKRSKGSRGSSPPFVFWPKDLLPQDCPSARIMTWGYDSQRSTFREHARNLLLDLERSRQRSANRPLMFVGHDLGGIITKQMLCDSELARDDPDLRRIWTSTRTVIFLGTPHRGGNYGDMSSLKQSLLCISQRDSSRQNLALLEPNGQYLPPLENSFNRIIDRHAIRIHSFKEGKGMSGFKPKSKMLVEPWSSEIGDRGNERVEVVNANHFEMCQFYDRDDPGYNQVGAAIADYVAHVA